MIVNQNEISFDFEEETAKNELIQQLMLNPIKYREFKQNINRINNVDNEINFIKSQTSTKVINYAKDIQISKEEYESSVNQINEIADSITEEHIIDIMSHKKLLSTQKHILEIFAYLIGFEYFDWNMIREKLTLYELKTRIGQINYEKFQIKYINVLLSKICKHKQFSQIASESEMNLIYEWSKAQLKIILYLYQNGLLKKKSQLNNYNEDDASNNTTNNQISSYNDTQSKKRIDLLSGNKVITLRGNKPKNNQPTQSHHLFRSTNDNMPMTNNNVSTNIDKGMMLTALPNINENPQRIQVNKPMNKVNNVIVELNGFDYSEKFIKREEKIIEYLPLLKNRTFQQMRRYYNIQSKKGKDFERRHLKELRPFGDQDNKQKILNLIGLNKIEILNKLPYHKLKEIIENI